MFVCINSMMFLFGKLDNGITERFFEDQDLEHFKQESTQFYHVEPTFSIQLFKLF